MIKLKTNLFNIVLASTALVASMSAVACNQTDKDIIQNTLRAPAYPLVTIDPYTSAWSATDNLYDSAIQHWTGKEYPLVGALKVDGQVYRFMGVEDVELLPVVPTSYQGGWNGKYTVSKPEGNWTSLQFDDSAWKTAPSAFGTKINEPLSKTDWTDERIWVRREFELEESLEGRNVFLEFCNDDDAFFYINGVEVHSTGPVCNKYAQVKLSPEVISTLKKGKNIIAANCWNPIGNGLLDFGLLVQKELHTSLERTALQTSVDVQATQTHYQFDCGGVNLNLTFTAPMFMEDLDLLSRPVNYISYDIVSNDGKEHDVEIYIEASPRWAVNMPYDSCVSEMYAKNGLIGMKAGSKEQNILGKSGDDLRIDWGYFHLVAEEANTIACIGNGDDLKKAFVHGTFSCSGIKGEDENAKMALVRKLGRTDKADGSFLIAYDDIYSIQYFGQNLRPYWNRRNDSSIDEQIALAVKDYDKLIRRCYSFDRQLMKDAEKAGGRKYAELCALAYRQAIAAHKLVESPEGDLLWLSKENFSNGSIGTVDVTYPSAPLFLLYNPELAKGLMNHIYHYSESGRWTKPFPAHDVGTYPLANGQTYGGDMPVEEAGNMITLTAAVCASEGKADYAKKHWDVLTTWTDYLVEKGLDPENQLCTDDFAGHFAHNANLSIKAIVAIASYGQMADMLGMKDVAEKYQDIASSLARKWMEMADDNDHYKLTFDKSGTWSQKYNLVWDKLLRLDVFPDSVRQKEVAYYLGKQNIYGLPLDSRMAYTKTDWIMWTATLADDKATFEKFVDPVHKFENETVDRVPMSDWIWTDKPNWRGFKARSVVGGYFIKMLEEKYETEHENL